MTVSKPLAVGSLAGAVTALVLAASPVRAAPISHAPDIAPDAPRAALVDWRGYRHCHWAGGRRWCHGGGGRYWGGGPYWGRPGVYFGIGPRWGWGGPRWGWRGGHGWGGHGRWR